MTLQAVVVLQAKVLSFTPGGHKQCPGSINEDLKVMESVLVRSLNIGHLQIEIFRSMIRLSEEKVRLSGD